MPAASRSPGRAHGCLHGPWRAGGPPPRERHPRRTGRPARRSAPGPRGARSAPPSPGSPRVPPAPRAPCGYLRACPPLYHLGLGYKRRAIPLAMRPRLLPLQLGVLSFPIGTPIDLGDGGPALPSEVVEHGAPNHRGAPRALHLLVGVEPRQEPFIE